MPGTPGVRRTHFSPCSNWIVDEFDVVSVADGFPVVGEVFGFEALAADLFGVRGRRRWSG